MERLVEHTFRRSWGRLVASLVAAMGGRELETAEEVVQDAFVRALRLWPWKGVPRDPEAWLFRVARNRALDLLRRRGRWEVDLDPTGAGHRPHINTSTGAETGDAGPFDDDELALLFLCCDPALTPDQAVALTLRTAGGLGTREIAAAFLVSEQAAAQRLVRARRILRDGGPTLPLDAVRPTPERTDSVLRVVYLMFNEGYAATEGEALVRRELCAEAVRLAELLARHPATSGPEVDALLALLLLQSSRLPSRESPDGRLLPLPEQDRREWEAPTLDRGLRLLERAARGSRLTPWHLEAGIAACHATAARFDDTDWHAILRLYDLLLDLAPSGVVALNRAVAVAMVRGPDAALALLPGLDDDPTLAAGHLLEAVRAWLLDRAGRPDAATRAWRRAATRARSAPVRRHLEERGRDAAGRARRGTQDTGLGEVPP